MSRRAGSWRTGVVVIASAFIVSGHVPVWIGIVVGGTDLLLAGLFLVRRQSRRRSVTLPSVSAVGKARTAALMLGLLLVAVGRLQEHGGAEAIAVFAGRAGIAVTAVGAILHVVSGVGYRRGLVRAGGGAHCHAEAR